MSYVSGSNAVLSVSFTTALGSAPVDVTDLSLVIRDDSGAAVEGPTTDVTHVSTGIYTYTWAIPSDQDSGVYTATWTATEATALESFDVVGPPDSAVNIATWQNVYNITGVSVDDIEITRAQAIIEMHAAIDLSEFSTNFSASNSRWLIRAVCYQTVWMRSQPDMLSRVDLQNLNHDGMDVTVRDRHSYTLAPLARRALERCTWMRSRTVELADRRLKYPDETIYDGLDEEWTSMPV